MVNIVCSNELMSLFDINKKQLDILLENGLPHYLIGNSYRFSVLDVYEFLKSNYKTLIPNSDFYQYLSDNNLSIDDFWDEKSLLHFFSISIEDLALTCYRGFTPLNFKGSNYFKKKDFFDFISSFNQNYLSNEGIVSEKKTIPFPCFVTDAGYSEPLSAYRCGITLLESETNIGHISFNGSLTSGGSAYAEIIALYRTFKIIEGEGILSGSILTDQKRFVDFWNNDDDTVLQVIKSKTFLSHIADFMIEFRDINKQNFIIEHISDNNRNSFDSIFNEAYENSHNLCQDNNKKISTEKLKTNLSEYAFKEDFISLVSLNKEFENEFFLKPLADKPQLENEFSIQLWDLFKDKTSILEMKFSPNVLHALLVAATNYKTYNPSANISILLSDSNRIKLDSILNLDSPSKSEKVIIKHYNNLTNNGTKFVNSDFEESLLELSQKKPS